MSTEYWVSRRIVENLPVGVVIQCPQGRIVHCNGSAERILGIARGRLIGMQAVDPSWHATHLDGTPFAESEHPSVQTLKTGLAVHDVVMGVRRPDASQAWISITSSLVQDLEGLNTGEVMSVFEDVTERIHNQRNLQNEQVNRIRVQRFSDALLSALPTPVFYGDVHGVFQGCNEAFTKLTKLSAQDIRGKTIQELWPHHVSHVLSQKDPLLQKTEHRETYAFHVVDSWGHTRKFLFDRSTWLDSSNNPGGWVGTITELTAYEQSQAALQHSRGRLNTILANAGVGIVFGDINGYLVETNAAFNAMLNYEGGAMVGLSMADITHPDDVQQEAVLFRDLADGKSDRFTVEKRFIRKGGTDFWAQISVSVLRGEGGEIENLIYVVNDIAERHRYQDELADSRAFSDAILDSMDISIAVVDRQGIIIAVNEGWRRYANDGMAPPDLLDGKGLDYFAVLRNLAETSTEIQAREVLCGLENVIGGRIPSFSFEYPCEMPSGITLWYQLRATPLNTQVGGLVISHIDITMQRQAQSEALRLKEELEDRVKQRTADLAAANSDLHTQQLRLNFLKSLAERANVADELEDVLFFCVRELCQLASWSYGHVYFVSPASNELVPSALRYEPQPILREGASQNRLAPAQGLAGRAWVQQRAAWLSVENSDEAKQLQDRFSSGNILWSLALPVLAGRNVSAVIEFASNNVNMLGADSHAFIDQLFALLQVIADRKENEREMRKLALIAQHTDNAIIISDALGKIEWVNPGYTKITGYTLEESLGKRPGELLQGPLTDPVTVANLREAVRKGEKAECEILNYSKEGNLYWLELAIYPARNSAGELEHFVAIERDISERRRLMADLEKSKAIAESANRAKGDFLANMSHEIRTPMNAITGMTELVLATELTVKQRNYVSKIKNASDLLLHIINDVLDFSKIEAGMLQMEHVEFNLDEVLHNVGTLLARPSEEKGIELIFEVCPKVPSTLIGDPLRLGQILINLVGNAIKFSHAGSVLVRVKSEPPDNSDITLRFEVVDQGIGMSAKELDGLFNAFTQADSSTTRRYGGTGLGLAICKRLVQLLGGSISAESVPGQGSTFEFSVQLGCKESTVSRIELLRQALAPYKASPVLVIDDRELTCKIVEAQLKQLGLTADCYLSGASALSAIADASAPDYLFVLCDLSMPDMNGVETIRQLHSHYQSKKRPAPPVIIMTAASHAETLEQIDFRLDGFLSKPTSPSSIVAEIAPWLGLSDMPAVFRSASHFAPNTARFSGVEILLVEDTDLNKEVMVDILRSANMQVRVASNGAEALRLIRDKMPACVLMDCQMPVMDGFEASRRIRENPAWRDMPVIALTANAMASDRQRCIEAGMNDHLAKPIRQGELFAALDRWIQAGTSSRPGPDQSTAPQGTSVPELEGIRAEIGLAVVGGKVPLYLRLLRKLRDHHLLGFVSTFEELVAAKDWTAAARLAHTVKGAALTVGAEELADALRALEIGVNEDPTSIGPALNTASVLTSRMIEELAKVPVSGPVPAEPLPTLDPAQVCRRLSLLLEDRDTAASAYLTEFDHAFAGHPRQRLVTEIRNAVSRYDHANALAGLRTLQQVLASSENSQPNVQ